MSRSYLPIQHFEAKQLSVNLLDDPENFIMHNRRYSSSVIMQLVYGRRVPQCTCSRTFHLTDRGLRRYQENIQRSGAVYKFPPPRYLASGNIPFPGKVETFQSD